MSNDSTGQCARTVVRAPVDSAVQNAANSAVRTAVQKAAENAADSARDPRVTGLSDSVARLRRELAGYRARLSDREIAEDALAALDAAAAAGVPLIERLRGSLLVLTSALGSVSALAPSLAEVRAAIDLFGPIPAPRSRHETTPGAGCGPSLG